MLKTQEYKRFNNIGTCTDCNERFNIFNQRASNPWSKTKLSICPIRHYCIQIPTLRVAKDIVLVKGSSGLLR